MRSALPAVVAWLAFATAACGTAGAPLANDPGEDAGKSVDGSPRGEPAGPPLLDGAPSLDSSASSTPLPLDDAAGDAGVSPPLHIDLSQTSVSGISSGGFMAVQFGVAFSSTVSGIAVFAGGPFGCAQGSLATAEAECEDATLAPAIPPLVAATRSLAAAGAIDDPSHLATTRVFLFGGADDTVVWPPVMDAAAAYFAAFVPAGSIQTVSRRAATGHTFPTLSYGSACAASTAPWIGDCGYDGAGLALSRIYGALSPAASAPSGAIVTLAQGSFIADPASHSLGATAYLYVPAACASGETCRVHVAFHGCAMQASGGVGSAFYLHAGYNEWADTNHIVVLYPQTIATTANPNACWDWWGYDSAQYDTQSAPQMAMTRAMLASLAGASGDP